MSINHEVLSWVDDLGLDPFEFRVYMHLLTREDGADTTAGSIAKSCGMSVGRTRTCLTSLENVGLILTTPASDSLDVNPYQLKDRGLL